MLPEAHPLFKKLDAVFSYRTERATSTTPGMHHDVRPVMPIQFYDRHVAPNLQLRRIETVTEIPNLLARFAEEEIDGYFSTERSTRPSKLFALPYGMKKLRKEGSYRSADIYETNCHRLSAIPAQLYLCPDKEFWQPFSFDIGPLGQVKFLTLGGFKIPGEWITDGEAAMVLKLRPLRQHSPLLAIWNFFAYDPSTEALLKNIKDDKQFHWSTTATKVSSASQCSSIAPPADSSTGFMGRFYETQKKAGAKRSPPPMAATSKAPRRRLPGTARVAATQHPLELTLARPYRADPKHYLQHAWSQAVFNDATFIVFNCGRYERIGIRHRQTQTLFLSGLVDSASVQDPAYGKIQAGLQMAIIQDALNRQESRTSGSNTLPRKRQLEEGSAQPLQKRAKIDAEVPDNVTQETNPVCEALSTRPLVLISLQGGAYDPFYASAFVRVGASCVAGYGDEEPSCKRPKKTYNQGEYVALRLFDPIGEGATGVIHRGTASIYMENGTSLEHPVAIKLVFPGNMFDIPGEIDFPAQDRMRNEFRIYQHLAKSAVTKGILPVYGLFEDMESGVLALVMDDGGQSLAERELQNGGTAWKLTMVSNDERECLSDSLRKIHAAGIRHCDIRGQNMVVNLRGEVFFVDFDKAERCDRAEALSRELKCLDKILNGYENYTHFYSV